MKIHAQILGEHVLLSTKDLNKLVEIARQCGTIEVEISDAELSTPDLMQLAEQGRAFAFWHEEGEDIYAAEDGKPV